MKTKVGMISLGCAKNRVDAEMMLYTLREEGFELVQDVAYCDVAIVNTCGFIDDAKQESIDEILELAAMKKEGRIKAIIVTGCLAERYQEEILKELYEVDAVVGIGGNASIAQVVRNVVSENEKIELFPDKTLLPLCGGRIRSTPFYYTYLKIAEGCDNHCTYCAIPAIRGRFRSRPMEDILREAKELSSKGVREFIVIAQDTTRYGEDICGRQMLPELLEKLCSIENVKWVRVLYCYPERITDELIDVFAKEDKLLKYLDIPMQHCSAPVLKRMNRRGDREFLEGLVEKLRKRIPGVTIRTTFIAGFPGETEEDFAMLSDFIQKMRFERMGCFAYSVEEGTPAALLDGQLEDEIKLHRRDILMEQQAVIMNENAEKMKGRTVQALCEGYDRARKQWYGRTAADAPEVDCRIFFSCGETAPRIGDILDITVEETEDCDLIGISGK